MKFKHPLDPTPPATMADLLARLDQAMPPDGFVKVEAAVYGYVRSRKTTELSVFLSTKDGNDIVYSGDSVAVLYAKIIGTFMADGVEQVDSMARAGGGA
jgi:hypothetical protein